MHDALLSHPCTYRARGDMPALRRTLELALKGLITTAVSRIPADTMRFLNDWGKTEHSTVALKRVPICTPAAPRASAAKSWLPVATPPDARKGILSTFFARASCTNRPVSASPGRPPLSNPMSEIMSTPSVSSALFACDTFTHLCIITSTPPARNCACNFFIRSGAAPHVSTTLILFAHITCGQA
jgi:hypothetical protein